jgi:hypothetical protein
LGKSAFNASKKEITNSTLIYNDTLAKLFNVLIIKTDLAIPYTSVFFQLECGYWNAEAEAEAEENLRNELLK